MSQSDSLRQQVFDFIVQYKRTHDGNAPSVQDIADGCLLSKSGVKYHLLKLENARRIRLKGYRGIEVVGGEWTFDASAQPGE
jgi:hypothetical protein